MLQLLLALITSVVLLADPLCPAGAPVPANAMTPDAFRQWLQLNGGKLKTVQDLVCCLPPNYLKHYAVAHSIRAGQNGSPESPRVLLFDPEEKTNSMVLAFNGGEAYLNQPHNVEIGAFDPDRRFTIYDLEFYKRAADMSEKNPVRCLRCHSDNQNGARPLFHLSAATTYLGQTMACSPEEDDLQLKSQNLTLEAISQNPRFRCLDRSPAAQVNKSKLVTSGFFPDNFRKLRERMSDFEKTRLARLIHQTPSFDEFKYALIGAEVCASEFKPKEWLPPEIFKTLTNSSSLRSDVAAAESAANEVDLRRRLRDEGAARIRELRRIQRSDFQIRRGQFRPAFQSWNCPANSTFDRVPPLEFSATTPEDKLFAREVFDTNLRLFPASPLSTQTANLRFLLEGRGIDTRGWTLSFNQQEDFQPFESAWEELIYLEPSKGPLRSIMPNRAPTSNPELKRLCDQLKAASLTALAPHPTETAKPK